MGPTDLGSGRYEIQADIGEGVSAKVYRALDRRTGSTVAVKVLNRHLRTDAISIERFRREIQVTRRLGHPQIVSIYDLVTEDECTFLVMEYLEGRTLKEYVALEHPVETDVAVSILEQILHVLAVCHAQDVIHRDLKPQNVMIDAKARVKLLDFGIARVTTLRDLTQTGTSLGSPEYMAPELFATSTYDPRSDLYAVGVMAFELLAGHLPFQGDSLATLYQQHREADAPDLADLRSDAPAWLCELIRKLFAKRVHERYQSADEALMDLRQRQVLARSWPELPRLRCLRCAERTPGEIPLCTHCGNEHRPSLAAGRADLYCKEDQDTQKLRCFFSEYLNLDPPEGKRRSPLLLRGIETATLELVRARAARSRIYLDVRPSPRGPRSLREPVIAVASLALYWCLIPAVIVVSTGAAWNILFERKADGDLELFMTLFFFALVAFAATVVVGPMRAFRRLRRERPWLRGPHHLDAAVAQDRGIRELSEAFSGIGSLELRASLARMLEKYVLLNRRDGSADAEIDPKLQRLFQSSASLAQAASEIETTLGDPRQRAALLAADPTSEQAAVICRLEEAHASLLNKLIAVQSLFNQLVGCRLVLEDSVGDSELELLEGSLERVELDLEVQRSLQQALEGLA